MRLYKDDLEYMLKVVWFLENHSAPEGWFEEFNLKGFDAEVDLGFEWDGGWYVTVKQEVAD